MSSVRRTGRRWPRPPPPGRSASPVSSRPRTWRRPCAFTSPRILTVEAVPRRRLSPWRSEALTPARLPSSGDSLTMTSNGDETSDASSPVKPASLPDQLAAQLRPAALGLVLLTLITGVAYPAVLFGVGR